MIPYLGVKSSLCYILSFPVKINKLSGRPPWLNMWAASFSVYLQSVSIYFVNHTGLSGHQSCYRLQHRRRNQARGQNPGVLARIYGFRGDCNQPLTVLKEAAGKDFALIMNVSRFSIPRGLFGTVCDKVSHCA